jgi:hypothetical protein
MSDLTQNSFEAAIKEINEFHGDRVMAIQPTHLVFNLDELRDLPKITWREHMLLWFVKERRIESEEGVTIRFKRLRGKTYIMGFIRLDG